MSLENNTIAAIRTTDFFAAIVLFLIFHYTVSGVSLEKLLTVHSFAIKITKKQGNCGKMLDNNILV